MSRSRLRRTRQPRVWISNRVLVLGGQCSSGVRVLSVHHCGRFPVKHGIFRRSKTYDSLSYRYFGLDLSGLHQGRNKKGNPGLQSPSRRRSLRQRAEHESRQADVALRDSSPYIFDSTRFAKEFGFAGTPYPEGVRIAADSHKRKALKCPGESTCELCSHDGALGNRRVSP